MGGTAVDTAELARVRAQLEGLAAHLESAAARMAAGDALSLGARGVVQALERAQEDWLLHVSSLRLLAHVAARDLGAAAAAYAECEEGARRLVAGAADAVAAPGDDAPGRPLVVGVPAPAVLGPPVPPAAPAPGPPVPPVAAVVDDPAPGAQG